MTPPTGTLEIGPLLGDAAEGASVSGDSASLSALDLLNTHTPAFVAAFLVTLLATPVVRRIAIAGGVVDHPDETRKLHRYPVAYLGGLAVFFGILVAIGLNWFGPGAGDQQPVPLAIVIGMVAITFTGLADDVWGWDPRLKIAGQLVAAAGLAVNDIGVRVVEGIGTPIMGGPDTILFSALGLHVLNGHFYYWAGTALIAVFVLGGCNSANLLDGLDGLLSGVVGIVAVGLLAIGLLVAPLDHRAHDVTQTQAVAVSETVQDAVSRYQAGEGRVPPAIAALVRRGYLPDTPVLPVGWRIDYDAASGHAIPLDARWPTAVATVQDIQTEVRLFREREGRPPVELAELVTAGDLDAIPPMPLGFAIFYDPNDGRVAMRGEERSLSSVRIVLCLALLGAVLGFLPHNFKPAAIFLGDCGSLLLGYMCAVIILMLGDRGQTYFVFAGLIVFAVPIIDTTLAIIRRRLAGTSMSAADHQHLHHQLKRALGGVRRAVLALYGISGVFAAVGVSLVVLVLNGLRVRVIYAIALVLFSFIAVVAVKAARHQKLMAAVAAGTPETTGETTVEKSGPALRDESRAGVKAT